MSPGPTEAHPNIQELLKAIELLRNFKPEHMRVESYRTSPTIFNLHPCFFLDEVLRHPTFVLGKEVQPLDTEQYKYNENIPFFSTNVCYQEAVHRQRVNKQTNQLKISSKTHTFALCPFCDPFKLLREKEIDEASNGTRDSRIKSKKMGEIGNLIPTESPLHHFHSTMNSGYLHHVNGSHGVYKDSVARQPFLGFIGDYKSMKLRMVCPYSKGNDEACKAMLDFNLRDGDGFKAYFRHIASCHNGSHDGHEVKTYTTAKTFTPLSLDQYEATLAASPSFQSNDFNLLSNGALQQQITHLLESPVSEKPTRRRKYSSASYKSTKSRSLSRSSRFSSLQSVDVTMLQTSPPMNLVEATDLANQTEGSCASLNTGYTQELCGTISSTELSFSSNSSISINGSDSLLNTGNPSYLLHNSTTNSFLVDGIYQPDQDPPSYGIPFIENTEYVPDLTSTGIASSIEFNSLGEAQPSFFPYNEFKNTAVMTEDSTPSILRPSYLGADPKTTNHEAALNLVQPAPDLAIFDQSPGASYDWSAPLTTVLESPQNSLTQPSPPAPASQSDERAMLNTSLKLSEEEERYLETVDMILDLPHYDVPEAEWIQRSKTPQQDFE